MGLAGSIIKKQKYDFDKMNQLLLRSYKVGRKKHGQSFSTNGNEEW